MLSFLAHYPGRGGWEKMRALAAKRPLASCLRPIEDAFEVIGAPRHNGTIAVLFRECVRTGRTFWGWSGAEWIRILGRDAKSFCKRSGGRISQSERINIAAIAYLHGWFRDVLLLGHFKRDVLARRVFGTEAVAAAASVVLDPLRVWGYHVGSEHLSCLCEALLRNEHPCAERLTLEGLRQFQREAEPSKRSLFFQFSKSLASKGVVPHPLPRNHPRDGLQGADDVNSETWTAWVDRWCATSTIESRYRLRGHLQKLGRWLGSAHPAVNSPTQWTRELCADFVAAVSKMRVGEYTTRKVKNKRTGKPLSPRTIAAEISAARTFFSDCQEWDWIRRRFDPSRSLAVPRSVRRRISRNPRIIADSVWARLVWAGLQLTEADLPRVGRSGAAGPTYPLAYMRALAAVWLFSGLRSNEISRLRVGCIRLQEDIRDSAGRFVCLLDVPVHKTGADFTKPVDAYVGEAVEAWESVRPAQPRLVDGKTAERVDFLFMHRARPMRTEIINHSLIPLLCRKAGVECRDVRGNITSHRARATIASQLFNTRTPMSLVELQGWLGHRSPETTQHYVAVTPTRLARAYADAGYLERNVRAIEVLIDQDAITQTAGSEPWRFYDLGHGLCSYEFFDQCAHRMACARCDFYQPSCSSLVQLLKAKDNILRFLQEIPLSEEERAVVDGDLEAIDRLNAKLSSTTVS